ncbi:histidine phosphatase family protein [Anaerolineales bacterium]
MSQIILVRHSESLIEPERPAHEWTLTALGLHRCDQLSQEVLQYNPRRVVSSPEPKAYLTGEAISKNLRIGIETQEDLKEQLRYTAPYYDSIEEFEAQIKGIFDHPSEVKFGEETADSVYARMDRVIEESMYVPQTTVFVTHGTAMSIYVARKTHLSAYTFWKNLGLPAYIVMDYPEFRIIDLVNRLD